MTPLLRTVIAARVLLAEPSRWTRGAIVRDINDKPVVLRNQRGEPIAQPESSAARSWCLVGAAYKVGTPDEARAFLGLIRGLILGKPIPEWNDSASHADVVSLLGDALLVAQRRAV